MSYSVSADTMRAAQLITGVTMAIWIGIGVFPPLRPHAHMLRHAVLLLYLVGCLGFIVYALVGHAGSG